MDNVSKMWTSQERDEWIASAMNSDKQRGSRRGFYFNTMLKQNDAINDYEDPRRNYVTSNLAKALYGNHPLFKRLSLCFYKLLMTKMLQNSFVSLMYRKFNFVIMVKGSNAYKMLLRKLVTEIDYSDLDIIILINPFLSDDLFEQIKSSLCILVSQVMSRYKKDLDATLFPNEGKIEESILNSGFVSTFKETYNSLLSKYNDESNSGCLLSPFEDNIIRNQCSKKSFIIADSNVQDGHVVRVEVPHLDKCEFIPLKKSPLVVSHNKAIKFKRDVDEKYEGAFELIRMRMNNMFIPSSSDDVCNEDNKSHSSHSSGVEGVEAKCMQRHKIIPADFIDVSIPLKHDAELLDFWSSGGSRRCYEIYDKFVGAPIMIPNLNECIRDIHNMINLYTNTHVKIEKRVKRLELFKKLDDARKNWKSDTNNVASEDALMISD
jgi:hypothetical protein